jgi:hypothetical protein
MAGERITKELLDYLRSGLAAGMQLPDPADPSLETIRVVSYAPVRPDNSRSGPCGRIVQAMFTDSEACHRRWGHV